MEGLKPSRSGVVARLPSGWGDCRGSDCSTVGADSGGLENDGDREREVVVWKGVEGLKPSPSGVVARLSS